MDIVRGISSLHIVGASLGHISPIASLIELAQLMPLSLCLFLIHVFVSVIQSAAQRGHSFFAIVVVVVVVIHLFGIQTAVYLAISSIEISSFTQLCFETMFQH